MHLDLSDAEIAALTEELDAITRNDRYPFSKRVRTLKAILAKFRRSRQPSVCCPPKVYAPPRATDERRRRKSPFSLKPGEAI
jgi:hypothetical protein